MKELLYNAGAMGQPSQTERFLFWTKVGQHGLQTWGQSNSPRFVKFCVRQFMYCNYIFFAEFLLLCLLLLFICIPWAGWNANTQLEKEKKREWDQKRENCMNCCSQKLWDLGILYIRKLSSHRRRIDTENKANSRHFCLGGKIVCRNGNFCSECAVLCTQPLYFSLYFCGGGGGCFMCRFVFHV